MKAQAMLVLMIAVAGLMACGEEAQPGGVTAEESRQLDEAANMLDASPDSLAAPEDAALGNGEAGLVEEVAPVSNAE